MVRFLCRYPLLCHAVLAHLPFFTHALAIDFAGNGDSEVEGEGRGGTDGRGVEGRPGEMLRCCEEWMPPLALQGGLLTCRVSDCCCAALCVSVSVCFVLCVALCFVLVFSRRVFGSLAITPRK